MKKLIAELTGTFFIMLTVLMVSGEMSGLAIGAIAVAMMMAGGAVSGGHFNPAITLAMFVQGRILRDDLPVYWVAQIGGAILATMMAGVLGSCTTPAIEHVLYTPRPICSLLTEFLGAFALVYVYLSTWASEKDNGRWAVGAVLAGLTMVFSKITGAFFNPALAAGGAISGMITWGNMLMFALCHFLAAAVATTVVKN